jgi:hypothetical protein
MLAAVPESVSLPDCVVVAKVAVPVAVRLAKVAVPENAGDIEKTERPVPVSSVTAPRRLAEVNDPSMVALPVEVMAPVRFAFVVTVPAVRPAAVPVMFVPTSVDGVPRFGVTRVGLVAKTAAPVPVSSLNDERRFAEVIDDAAVP